MELLGAGLRERRIHTGDLVVHEVLRGIRHELQFVRVRRQLVELELHSLAGVDVAVRSAEHFRLLRSRGVTVRSAIDCLIATYCIETGLELLHADRDFDPFEEHLGLRVYRG